MLNRSIEIFLAVTAAVITLPSCKLKTTSTPVKVAIPLNASFLCLYELSVEMKDGFSERLVTEDGDAWYRSDEAEVCLDCCNPSRTYAARFGGGGYGVMLHIKHECEPALEQWSKLRVGQMVGMVIDEELVFVTKLETTLNTTISAHVNGGFDDAEELRRRIFEEGYLRAP